MYLILNTAISHRWGMPEPCPIEKCPVCWRCYDCTNPDCQCALPDGMKNCKNLPAEMKIDYIRLYQDREDPMHTIGCSPPGYPTKEFIEAHADRYADWQPMTEANLTDYHVNLVAVVCMLVLLLLVLLMLSFPQFTEKLWYNSSIHRSGYEEISDEEERR